MKHPLSKTALVSFTIALLSMIVAITAGVGTRFEWWHFSTGFIVLRWAVYAATLSLVLSLFGAYIIRPNGQRRGAMWICLALAGALTVVIAPLSWLHTARSVPPIHDISTDTQNPPPFIAVVPLRDKASNPVEYGGPTIAAQQRQAYPDLEPLMLSLSEQQIFNRATKVINNMGWHIITADPATGRIEATDTTFWFGFKDDIVIRIMSDHNGTRLDIRSLSRVGRSDAGTNAKRIRNFMKLMKNANL